MSNMVHKYMSIANEGLSENVVLNEDLLKTDQVIYFKDPEDGKRKYGLITIDDDRSLGQSIRVWIVEYQGPLGFKKTGEVALVPLSNIESVLQENHMGGKKKKRTNKKRTNKKRTKKRK